MHVKQFFCLFALYIRTTNFQTNKKECQYTKSGRVKVECCLLILGNTDVVYKIVREIFYF